MTADTDTTSSHGNGVRDEGGKFAKGNPGGPGNPMARKVAQLRAALINSVSADDLKQIIAALLEKAKAGEIPAAKELLERCLGKPLEYDLLDRLDSVEALLEAARQARRRM